MPRASSTACSLRGERRVGALDLAGVDQGLAVEAHLAALPALGQEAVGVLHVVVDAVEDRLAGRRGRRAARGESPVSSGCAARARARRTAPWRGRWCPSPARSAGRRRAAISSACSIASGVSTIAHSFVCSGAPCRLHRRRPARAPRRRCRPWARRSRPGPAAHAAARSSSCHSVSAPLTRIVTSRAPYSPDAAAAQAASRAAGLASGATASSRSRISASHGMRLRLLQRALVGRWACRAPSGGAGTSVGHGQASDLDRVVQLLQLRVDRGQLLGELDHHQALLEGGVVLHLAVEHHRAGAVAHGRDDPAGVRDVLDAGAEDPVGDRDLLGVQAPGADAAEQEGVAELVLARDHVGDVAERAVVRGRSRASRRRRPSGRSCSATGPAGTSRGRRSTSAVRGRSSGPGARGSRGGRRRRGWSSSGGRRRGRPGRGERPCIRGRAPQISSTLATPRAVSRIACTRIGRSRPALASSWASSRST